MIFKSLERMAGQIKESLNMEMAILSRIESDDYIIKQVVSDFPAFNVGDVFPLKDTYCQDVVSLKKTVTYTNVGKIEEMVLHPVYVAMQLNSYIGTPLIVNHRIWGTLNFSSTLPKDKEFSSSEIRRVEELAHLYSDILTEAPDINL